MPLATAEREYREQQYLAALAVAEAERVATRGAVAVAQTTQVYQAAAVALSMEALAGLLAEQGIDAAQDAATVPAALLTGVQDLAQMVTSAVTPQSFARLVATMVRDARRTARVVDAVTRPAVTGYVRRVTLPCCGRCAVLAGRVYRYSEGFLRHPGCDCDPTPTDLANGRELVTDPMDAFERGQITGLSKADVEAIRAGADLGQVVNVRRKAAGMTVGSSVMVRAGRLTPQGCLSLASDRVEALELLRRYGYVT